MDLAGGTPSHRVHHLAASLLGRPGGLLLARAAALLLAAPEPHPAGLSRGALSGLGSGVAMPGAAAATVLPALG